MQGILVTGSHRSGSTWVGRMLAASPGVRYISEPFSVNSPSGVCRADFGRWYTYVSDENAADYEDAIADTLGFRYALGRELLELPANWRGAARRRSRERTLEDGERTVAVQEPLPMPRPVRRMVKDSVSFTRGRMLSELPLMKDPMALFSSPWLVRTFGLTPVIVIRHPAAFASSLQRVGWGFPFEDFLAQPALMRDLLDPFAAEIEEYAREDMPLLDQATVLWRVIHHAIARFQDEHPDWLFVRHEDLSTDPPGEFRRLYDALGLTWDEAAEQAVAEHTSGDNPAEAPGREVEVLKRDSRANVTTWKSRLTAEEAERVRERVADVAPRFYADDEW